MEIEDLSWNEVTAKRFNNPLLPRSIRGIIVDKSGFGKQHFCLIFYLDRVGSITITFAYSEKVFFSPHIEYLKSLRRKFTERVYFKIV